MEYRRTNLWNEAGKAGLVLGLVSIIYLVLTHFTGKIAAAGGLAVLVGTLNFLLWAGKLFLCVWLMRRFLLQYYASYPDSDSGRLFRYGTIIALYSAILYSAFYLVYILYIAPESMSAAFDAAMTQYAGKADASALESLENMKSDLPAISLVVNLIWCWLFGTVLSAIFSRKIASGNDNPFNE